MAARSLRVLLAENRLSETGIVLRSLCAEAGWALELRFVGRQSELAHALPTHCPEVALLALSLLQPDAPARLHVLHRTNPAIPLIIFADPADYVCAVKCLSMGAKDFLLAGFMDERTMARVLRSAVGERCAAGLATGSPGQVPGPGMNLPWMDRERPHPGSSTNISQAREISVYMENLEEVQNQIGIQAVEWMQLEMTEVLRKSVRASDLVAPISRGRMLVILNGASDLCFAAILQRIRMQVNRYKPFFLPSFSPAITVHEEGTARVFQKLLPDALPPETRATETTRMSPDAC